LTERTLTTIALATLVVGLSILGALTGNVTVLTMAAGSLTGLFAWLQSPKA
jgi:hypothetical protein